MPAKVVLSGAILAVLAMPALAEKPAASKPAAQPQVTRDATLSNWPAHPERQAGQEYRKVVPDSFGPRERNFESGRR